MKRILLSFTLFLLCMTGAWAYDFEVGGIYYNIISGTQNVEVTSGYAGYSGSVVIPESVTNNGTTYSVTSIGDYDFSFCGGLTSVTIPNSVTSIGDYAFSISSNLTSVTIPNSVTSIGVQAFYSCSGLTSVEWNAKKCADFEYSTYAPFKNCTSITTFTFGNEVEYIPANLCSDLSGLTSVTIPNSVTYIGDVAFSGCSGLTSVEWNAKKCADFESSTYAPFQDCTSITTFTFGNEVEYIPANLCCGLSGLTSVTIPNSVTSIGGLAFYNCSGLTSVTIPNSVTSIGDYAFEGCSGLTSVTIPNSVTSIGVQAFYSCSGLTAPVYNNNVFAYMPTSYQGSYSIPDGIKSVAGGAFAGCGNLTSVTIPNSVTSIGGSAFSGCSGLTSVEWNAKKCADFDYYIRPFEDCTSITTFTFGNEVEYIPANLCSDLSGLTSVTIPNSVTSIGNSAFSGCSGLTSVTIPNSVTSIGNSAFSGCSGLTSVTIPNSVTSIGNKAFYGTKIRTLVYNENVFAYMPAFYEGEYTVPDGIKSVAGGAFAGCGYLTSVTIPNSVTTIGELAFTECIGLKSVYVYATEPPVLKSGILDEDRKLKVKFYVPEASEAAYTSAEVWKEYFIFPMSELEMFKVTVSSNDAAMGTVSGGGDYHKGATATLTATANEGYHFVKWSDENTNATRELTVTENVELEATFAAIEYTVNVTSADETMGTVIVEGEAPYTYGEKVTLKATAKTGYAFVKWSDDNTNATRELIITSDTTLTATFAAIVEPATPVITIDNADVTVDGTFYAGDKVEAKFTVNATDLTGDITFKAEDVTFTPEKIAKDNADLAAGVEVTAAFKAAATTGENTVTITVKSEGADSKTVTVKYTVTEETGVENVTVASTVWSESGMLFIEAAAEAQATVYTLQGQVVETLNLTQGVNTVALPSATYIVKVGETAVKVSVR